MSMNASLISGSGLVGEALSPSARWATLPISGLFLLTMLSTLPASLLMQRKGRRFGFVLACFIMMLGGVITAFSIYHSSFIGFVAGAMVFGIAMGFFQLIRFAAIDLVPEEYVSKAISWVLLGGLLAAFLGPNIASFTYLLDARHPFFATMLSAIPLAMIMIFFLNKVDFPPVSAEEISGKQRPLRQIIKQPVFIVAVGCAAIAYSVMILLMTATPLAMKGHGFAFQQTAFIIQWHFVGMFAPSFFTGSLINRFGVLRVMMVGVIAFLFVVALNMQSQSHSLATYWLALLLLGVGWNFLFVGATSLLHEVWLPAEKGKIQGINDMFVFSMSALGAMSSGYLYSSVGWSAVNFVTLPFITLAGSLIIYSKFRHKVEVPSKAYT